MEPIVTAVIVEPAPATALAPLLEARPLGLLPLGSRTIIDRLLAALAGAGVREVDLLLGHLPEQTRTHIGNGARWGLTLRCRDIGDCAGMWAHPDELRRYIPRGGIALGMELVLDDAELRSAISGAREGKTGFFDAEGQRIPMCVLRGESEARHRAGIGSARRIVSAHDLWQENISALHGHGETLHVERCIGPGRYVGTGTRIAGDATLLGPSLIGPGVALASQVRIGPNVVIGAGVVIDESAEISDSLILEGTYIGPYMTIRGKIVDAGKVLDVKTQAVARVDDPTIVGATTITTGSESSLAAFGGLLVALGSLAVDSTLLALHGAGIRLEDALKRLCEVLLAAVLLIAAAAPVAFFALIRRSQARRIAVYGRFGHPLSYTVRRLFPRGHPLWSLNYAGVLWHVVCGRIGLTGPRLPWFASGRASYMLTAVAPGLLSPYALQRRAQLVRQAPHVADALFTTRAPLLVHLGLIARFLLSLALGSVPRRMPPSVNLVGVRIANLSMDQALERIAAMAAGQDLQQVAFVNADCLNISTRDGSYRALLARIPLVLADGIGVRQALKWFLRTGLKENVNGTDLFPRLSQLAAERGWSVYFLGARPGVARAAADNARKLHPGLAVAGTRDGYFSEQETEQVIAQINASRADILLVAMGVPAQDLWIARHAGQLRAKVAIGVGGLFDFYSGRIPRAPLWMRELGLEWIYRLLQEPGRMWRRYLIGNPLFMWRAWRAARRERRTAAVPAAQPAGQTNA